MESLDLHLTLTVDRAGNSISRARRRLRAVGERSGSAVVLRVGGNVDASNVAAWRHLLGQTARTAWTPGSVIVDISGLDFLACCGFVALAEESTRCRGRGIRLCVVDNHTITARVINGTRLHADLPLYPRVEAALDAERSMITDAGGVTKAG